MKDNGKFTLVISKVMLGYLSCWPLEKSKILFFFRYFLLLNGILISISHIIYLISNITNVAIMANTCATVSTNTQTVTKVGLFIIYRKEFASIVQTITEEFWPASVVNAETERSILKSSRFIIICVSTYLGMAFFSCWHFSAHHLVKGDRILSLQLVVNFDETASPTYEILFVWEFIFSQYLVINIIAVHDFFFNTLITNCCSQFKLIEAALQSIGTPHQKIVNNRIKPLPHLRINSDTKEDVAYELVAKCAHHHNLVIKICDELQNIYGFMILLQFLLSATALCVSAVVMDKFPEYANVMVSFLMVHLVQFFILCSMGTELMWRSGAVTDGACMSHWANVSSSRVRHALVLIIQRAQRPQVITALGFAILDYTNFINILRMSFSFYTLLTSLDE